MLRLFDLLIHTAGGFGKTNPEEHKEEVLRMGQNHQFKAGQKAPNNGVYVEIGETGSMVVNPQKVHLKAGDRFPETANQNRVWMYQRKP